MRCNFFKHSLPCGSIIRFYVQVICKVECNTTSAPQYVKHLFYL